MIITGTTIRNVSVFDRGFKVIPDALSPAGQAAYANASVGSFFEVSASDYNTVFTSLAGTSKIGMTDSQTNEVAVGQWSGTYAITFPQANATVPVNNCVIGFLSSLATGATSTTWSIYAGTTYRGTYSALGNTATISTSGKHYFLCKQPPLLTSTNYISIYSNVFTGSFTQGNTSFAGGYSSNFSTWSNQTGGMPTFQALITTTAT